ncbi:K02A2.6-like [Cordylochernes scorpioides]|uniref:RNA-directed DNA polymerase n=1 Tax=Cordylochernes scorpioides TaxID=51811 RepID=A0ABY6L8D1_9ARAC|nr:K02A2.6-like [Cordylochernes scorpioides]
MKRRMQLKLSMLVQIQKGKEYSTTERECLAIIWAINKFRPYVFVQPFTIVTDHHSLCWLTNPKDPCGRLARWALRLQEFDVTVVYKSGKKHQDADCLPRSPLYYSEDIEEDIPSIMTLQNISEEQMNDQALRKIADQLQSTPNNSFVKIDKTLYYPWLLVVARHLRQELLKKLHNSPTAGHLGFTKTYDRIRKKYYLPGMYRTNAEATCRRRAPVGCRRARDYPVRAHGFRLGLFHVTARHARAQGSHVLDGSQRARAAGRRGHVDWPTPDLATQISPKSSTVLYCSFDGGVGRVKITIHKTSKFLKSHIFFLANNAFHATTTLRKDDTQNREAFHPKSCMWLTSRRLPTPAL